jgi:hypothetical protein
LDAAALPPAKKAKAKPPGRRVGLQGWGGFFRSP